MSKWMREDARVSLRNDFWKVKFDKSTLRIDGASHWKPREKDSKHYWGTINSQTELAVQAAVQNKEFNLESGTINLPSESLMLDEMGIVTRTLWPLMAAAKVWKDSDRESKRFAKLGKRPTLDGRSASSEIIDRLSLDVSDLEKERLRKLIQKLFTASRGIYPNKEIADLIEDYFIDYICEIFPSLDIKRVKGFTKETLHKSPLDVLEDLLPIILGLKVPNHIDPYLQPTTQEPSPVVRESLGDLTAVIKDTENYKIAYLYGSSFGGKTQVMIELIKQITGKRKADFNPNGLPIFAAQCKDLHFSKILAKVFDFWNLNHPALENIKFIDDQTKWQNISNAAKYPAIYIFNCVKVFDRDTDDSYFAGRSFADLVEMLVSKNPDTRVILAGSNIEFRPQNENPTLKYFSDQKISKKIDAKKATISDFQKLAVKILKGDEFFQKKIDKCIHSVSNVNLDTEIACPPMLALVSLAGLKGDLSNDITEQFLNLFCPEADEEVIAERHEAFYSDLCLTFLNIAENWASQYDTRHFQRVLKLLVSSNDAVYVSSLKIMLDEWEKSDPLPYSDENSKLKLDVPDHGEIYRFIQGWARMTDNRLVSASKGVSLSEIEKMPDEILNPSYCKEDIRIDPPIRKELEKIFERDLATELYFCRRLLARMARRRAKNTRENSILPPGTFFSNIERDIQSVLELLSSVDIQKVDLTTEIDGNVKRFEFGERDSFETLEDAAFSLDNLGNYSEVIRFAYRQSIREEIDTHNHRLSMILDDDKMRLHILSSLLHGVGKTYAVFEANKKPITLLPDNLEGGLDDRLKAVLSPMEQVSLLESIGIASFYYGQPKILNDAHENIRKAKSTIEESAKATKNRHADTKYRRDMNIRQEAEVRLLGYKVDFDILAFDESDPQMREKLDQTLEEITSLCEDTRLDKLFSETLSRKKTKQRMLERRLQILRLKRECGESNHSEILRTIMDIEISHKDISYLSDTLSPTAGFGGRLCRSLFYALLGNLALNNSEKGPWEKMGLRRDEVRSKLDSYLNLAVSRLARYSGAERASVLAMQCLRALFDEKYEIGLYCAQQAYDMTQYNNISRGVHVQISWIFCQAKYLSLRHACSANGVNSDFSELKQELIYLERVAEGGGFNMHRDFASRLLGQIEAGV